MISGNSPTIGPPSDCEGPGVALEHALEQGDQDARDDDDQGDRPRVAAELLEHPARGGERDPEAHRAPLLDQLQEGLLHVIGARPREQLLGRGGVEDVAVAHQQQLLAVHRLIHHVAGDEQRLAPRGQARELLPELGAEDRVEADRGLVENEDVGFAEQGRAQRDPGLLAAGEVDRRAIRVLAQPDRPDHLLDSARRCIDDAGEVGEVLADAEIRVDRRRLGDVGDPGAEVGRAGGLAEHRDRARLDDLDADDRADQRRLAGAAGPEQPGDRAAGDFERDAGEDELAAAPHGQLLDDDRGPLAHGLDTIARERGRRVPRLDRRMTVVVKLGSSIVADEDGEVRDAVLDSVCAQVAELHHAGEDVAMVTSGAIALGWRLMELAQRPRADRRAAGGLGGRPGERSSAPTSRGSPSTRRPCGPGAADLRTTSRCACTT